MRLNPILSVTALLGLLALVPVAPTIPVATVVDRPNTTSRNAFYVSNAAPLQPDFFVKLPVGSIKPNGWLLETLNRQADGLAGHLGQISVWLTKKNNAWLSKDGKGDYGWEELPYWLKGYGDMAYILDRPDMLAETKIWLDGTISSQRENGDFGPVQVKGNGKRDLWAQMLMLFCLQSSYEHRADPRILNLMTKYFKWQMTIPDNQFLEDYWEKSRGGDNLYSVYWLYNRTKEPFLLDLATKIDRNTANWRQDDNLPNWHNVNIAQCFREPATYYLQSGKKADLQATYRNFNLVREKYGQVPGGMWGGDENSRPGYDDPRQAVETCGMVEQMASDELLMRFTGDPMWADNCEDVAFNTLPAAFMPDYRSLRYLTAPNMVLNDSKNHSPGIQNEGPFLMMNPFSSRCCQHNHSNGWAYYAENLWMATPDNGLAAVLYNASTVTAKVGAKGETVTLTQATNYPFDGQVSVTVKAAKPVAFPLYLRVPAWCQQPTVRVNGKAVTFSAKSGQYIVLTDTWKTGDKITLDLPMAIAVRTWDRNKNSVSVNYGPLTYSLKIGEDYRKEDSRKTAVGDSKWQDNADQTKWPSYEIFPTTAWNYGLVLDGKPAQAFTVTRKPGPMSTYPFTAENAPITLTTKARKIPNWTLDKYGLCDTLPQSPVAVNTPVETVTLVPMGATRLRISAFPVVTAKQ